MNILLTIHHDLDPHSGAPGSVLKLGHAYETLGHTVHYYSFDNLPGWVPEMATGLLFPHYLPIHLSNLRSQKFDVIDASTGDAWVWGTIFRRLKKNPPLLVTRSHGLEHAVHLEYLEDARQGMLNLSWKYPLYHGGYRLWEVATSLRCADLVFLLNRQDLKYSTEQLGVNEHRAYVCPNGIPDEFLNLPFDPAPTSEDPTIRIAQVGTYIPRKGIQYGVPALNRILQRHPQVQVSFLGTACPADQVHADFEPSVRDRVKVIPRFQHETLPTLLKDCQIKLFTPLSEGFGKALVEGMACGLAPVTTAAPGPLEIVRDGYDAIVVPLRNSEVIEQALEKLITDRPYLEQLRHNAYATAQKYSWLNAAEKRLGLYADAIADSATPSRKP
jgi:glycosyltransferase involved in cell wall biosynthesis